MDTPRLPYKLNDRYAPSPLSVTTLDPNFSRFYCQFSAKKSDHELERALRDLQILPAFKLATLHFVRGTCHQFLDLIINNIKYVFRSDNPTNKGLVFIHLIQSINGIQRDLKNEIYTDHFEKIGRTGLLCALERLVDKLNEGRLFRGLDLSHRSLSHLDLTGFLIDLSNSNLNYTYLVNTNFANAKLTNCTWDGTDLSTVSGIHSAGSDDEVSSYSDDSSFDQAESPKYKLEHCRIT